MKFLVTMNMPAAGRQQDPDIPQRMVHSIIAGHASNSIDEFMTTLEGQGYIIVEEFYVDQTRRNGDVRSNGEISLLYPHVGKVKRYDDQGRP